ncbi:MAG: ABC transporter substrate-binding protein [Candidatus Nitrosotenuis sp.]|nr:ABC transporter substrate-binding protein [Candidatus Nitrosotenuis sp.]
MVGAAFAEKGTYVDTIQFIQYLEESTALEEVKKGNLDMYYARIPSELLSDRSSLDDLQIFYVTGGSFSLLVNPAQGDKFNPFSFQEARFALNYLVDRKLIVDDLMGGYGMPMVSNYGPFDPDYLLIVGELEKFHFRYNPEYADHLITKTLRENGAEKIGGKWTYEGAPIEITLFIRNDDAVRKSIGEIVSSELERLGFTVHKDFGDLNKAFVVVYGSDPAELKWNMYTEGYAGRSAFVRYDSLGLAQMYAPWFANMPGLNNPSYWNYENQHLDDVTQKIYSANFTTSQQRADLIREASTAGVTESVRIFLAAKVDPFVANKNVRGVINDFGGGIVNRFTAVNSQAGDDDLKIGVKQIYQGAWNPVRGLSDMYSKNVWDTLYDPGIFKNPYSGENFAVRQSWDVETAGPDGTLQVPADAITWDVKLQKWMSVGQNTRAVSKITYDLLWSNWHHGQRIDMNDVLYSVYFTQEWASASGQGDKTFDPEFSPQAAQSARTLVAIKPVDGDTIEVYVNYWHFDESDIADWGGVWVTMPWEISYAMEQAVIDGKVSFSRTDAQAKSLNWLSLIIPRDASLMQQYLTQFQSTKAVPPSLASQGNDWAYYDSRYGAAIDWIAEKNHAVISNGPFYLDSYSPEARTITVRSFVDETYPFEAGHWKKFEDVSLPKITHVNMPEVVAGGTSADIVVETADATDLYYFVSDAKGGLVDSGTLDVTGGRATIKLTEDATKSMSHGANDLKLYAVSESVLRPDIYAASFLVVDSDSDAGDVVVEQNASKTAKSEYGMVSLILGAVIIGVILYVRKLRKRTDH